MASFNYLVNLRNFLLFPEQKLLQRFQTFIWSNSGPLQTRPVDWNTQCVGKIGSEPLLCSFCFIGRYKVLMKGSFLTSEILFVPRQYHSFQNITLVYILAHVYLTLFSAKKKPNVFGILALGDYGRSFKSFYRYMKLLHHKNILICKNLVLERSNRARHHCRRRR